MMAECALCGLAVGPTPIRDADRMFCCPGCQNVYAILMESGLVREGQSLRDTELFRRSLELGLVSNPDRSGNPPPVPPGAETRDLLLHVEGMWCTSCAWLIERALCGERGVVSAEVLFASDLLKVKYCPQYLPPQRIAGRVESLGYRVGEYHGPGSPSSDSARKDLLLRIGVAAFLWANVMTLSTPIYVGYFEQIHPAARQFLPWLLALLSAPAVFWSAWPILRAAWLGARQRMVRVEALLGLGITAAWVYSSVQAVRGGPHIYFDTACAIVTLVLAGKLMEHGAKQKAAQALAGLYRMMPTKARLLQSGRERFIAVENLKPGVEFAVKPGERIPADGLVVEGCSGVDESLITGEAAPVVRQAGDEVLAGSLNSTGLLRVRATRAPEESTIAQIVRLVEQALGSRSTLERAVDRVVRWFVPGVVMIAAATWAGGVAGGLSGDTALLRAIAVLVIACPCALGIATPLALTAAVGAAARRGILVNDVRVLETVGRVNVLVLDKTGTVTEGNFRMRGMAAEAGAEALAVVASLEAASEHPLARAVVRHAGENGTPLLPVREAEVSEGMGIRGWVDGRLAFAGNAAMAASCGAEPPARWRQQAEEWEASGHTVSYFGWDRTVRGVLALGDRVRPDARAMVEALRQRGVHCLMVSGDSKAATEAVARMLGIEEFRAAVKPPEKAAVIDEFRARGAIVAAAGDGINDAPLLARADLGIAMGSAADLTMHAAPMVLMCNSLTRIPEAIDLARTTLRVVRQNLFWAFCYNTAGIALAVAGVLNPIVAAAAMVCSSLSVILNSMRLSRRTSGP